MDADHAQDIVALRKESVDRNSKIAKKSIDKYVALRKESVDRNITSGQLPTPEPPVALRKESVDRNYPHCPGKAVTTVALRKESVDRNFIAYTSVCFVCSRSPQGERG